MANTDYKSVDEYLAKQPEEVRPLLQRVRGIIRKAIPDAVETISYQIPAYKVQGRVAIYFAGWKEHFSIYPLSKALLDEFGDALDGYEMSKGTIRFPLAKRVPVKLIERIAKFKAKEARERTRTK